MAKGSGLLNNAFYESERTSAKLSHNDFSIDAGFDNMDENDNLVQYLMDKEDWEKRFIRKKSGVVDVDIASANEIFYTCYKIFKKETDAVNIFSIITDFYKIDSSIFYWKLVKKCRNVLAKDLSQRLGIDIDAKYKKNINVPGQTSFEIKYK